MLHLLLASPFIAALIIALVPAKFSRIAFPLSLLLGSIITILSFIVVSNGASSNGAPMATEPFAWFHIPGTTATVQYALFSDGLSAWMNVLASVLTLSALWVSFSSVRERFAMFAISVFLMQGALFGCFLASDAVLFFLFFEALVPPAALLIASFGGPGRKRAAILFAAFTLIGSAPMAVALWAIATWTGTTDGTQIAHAVASLPFVKVSLLFFAFALAFAVKTPLLPFHGWQAETYSEAPTGVTAILSGAMAKVGVFGFLRWTIPLFPQVALHYALPIALLGVATMIYGSLVALRQHDIKRLLAFSSLAHLGLAVAGCFTLYQSAIDGVVLMLIAHGFSAGAMFLLASLPERWSKTCNISSFGGMAGRSPIFAVLFLVTCIAAVAVPPTLGFVGEFLILQGIWQTMGPEIALLAGLGAILSAAYTLRLVQAMLFGKASNEHEAAKEISIGEMFAIVPLIVALFVLGVAPSAVLRTIDPAVGKNPTAVATAYPEKPSDATLR